MQGINLRREVKFVARDVQYFHILRWIRLHPEVFTKHHPDRWVNNIYYDTHDYHSYASNLSGESFRSKIRFRWYGSLATVRGGNLEIKMKRNSFGWKVNHLISSPCILDGEKWSDVTLRIGDSLHGKYKHFFLSHPNPIIINRYHREYYVSKDNNIRVTIDRKQSVFDQRYKPIVNISRKSFVPEVIVVEVKFNREHHDIATKVISGIPMRSSRNSKYMNAVNAVSGNSNIFP